MNNHDQQADDLTFRQLETLLHARGKLLAAAEQIARDAYAEMKRVAETLCPERVDDLRCESADGIDALDVHDLAELVIVAVGRRLRHLEASAAGGNVTALEEKVGRLQAEIARLQRQQVPASRIPSPPTLPPATATPKINRRGGKPPWRMAKAEPAPSRPAVPFDAWPEWGCEWKDKSKVGSEIGRARGCTSSASGELLVLTGQGLQDCQPVSGGELIYDLVWGLHSSCHLNLSVCGVSSCAP